MSKPDWVDATSYGRGDTERVPRTWRLQLPSGAALVLTRHIYYESTDWVVMLNPHETTITDDVSAVRAKEVALEWAEKILHKDLMALRSVAKIRGGSER